MSLSIGIVGLPNVGKSTLFNALTKAQNAQAANYPFCTIEPNKATVAVPDERVDALSAKVSPKKTIHASVDFIDIAGLVRGASKGEGLGNQFLGNIRECAAIVEVVRCFEDENITHVDGSVDPLRDIDTIETELLLADLQSVERRLEKLQKMAKGSKDAKAAAEIMQGLLEHLNAGNGARSFELPDNETFLQSWRELGLLTAKPVIYCANVDEAAVADGNDFVARVQQLAEERHERCQNHRPRQVAMKDDAPVAQQKLPRNFAGHGRRHHERVAGEELRAQKNDHHKADGKDEARHEAHHAGIFQSMGGRRGRDRAQADKDTGGHG